MTATVPPRDALAPLVDRFLGWKCPPTVRPDGVDGDRSGTNLLSGIEARAMLEHVLADCLVQPKITGYRQLDPAAGELMNEIKAAGIELQKLCGKVSERIEQQYAAALGASPEAIDATELERLDTADPRRWALWGREGMQMCLMQLTRAVAQPSTF